MNTDTPETEKLTDADFKNIDEDMETATLQAYNRLHDLCADMERERNQARQERDELANAIRSFCTDFEAIQWGYDGDGGSARLADILFESLEKLKEPKSEGV